LTIVARVALVIYAERRPELFDFPDSHRYVLVAQNIAGGRGPIESDDIHAGTDPLYPGVLAVGVLLGGDDFGAVMSFGRIANALFAVASVVLLASLARGLVGDRAALIAAAILAVDPILLFFNALVLTETCYTAIVLGGFWCVTRLGGRHRWRFAAGAGLLFGLATLTRSSSLLMPLVLLPMVWHFAGRKVRTLAPAGTGAPRPGVPGDGPGRKTTTVCFLLVTAAVLAPTTVRNYGLFGHVVPVRTGSGAGLMEGLGPWADGGPGMDRIEYPAFPSDADEYARDRICRAAALDWTRDHPREVMALAWAKLARTWSVTVNAPEYSSWLFTLAAWLTVAPEFVLAACGVWVLRRRPGVVALLLMVAIYSTLVHMVFVGSVRYRVPAMPFLFVLAGVAVDRLRSGAVQCLSRVPPGDRVA
jgi:hypothetical protein